MNDKKKKPQPVDRGFLRLFAAIVEAPEEVVLAKFLAKNKMVAGH